MSRQMKPYEDRLRQELLAMGLYNERNERLITCAARCNRMIDMMEDELRGHSLILSQTGSMGQMKVTQHPHVESIRKMNHTLALCLHYLGLGNQEIIEEAINDPVSRFIEDLEQME